MVSEVTLSEFQHLEARVSVLESEVEGEKVVSRYILEQTRANGDDLAALNTRVDGVEARLGGIEMLLDRVEKELRQFREELPGIVGEAVREALRQTGAPA